MASLLQILSTCLGFNRNYNALSPFDEDQVKAGQVITALNSADKAGSDLTMELNSIVGAKKWTRRLARAILHHLEHALVKGHVRGHALQHAYNRAFEEAADFPHDHPVFCTLLALGILVILAPWVLEALGFAELGPVEGKDLLCSPCQYCCCKLYLTDGTPFRNFCCLVAVDVRWICVTQIAVCILSTPWNGLASGWKSLNGILSQAIYLTANMANDKMKDSKSEVKALFSFYIVRFLINFAKMPISVELT